MTDSEQIRRLVMLAYFVGCELHELMSLPGGPDNDDLYWIARWLFAAAAIPIPSPDNFGVLVRQFVGDAHA